MKEVRRIDVFIASPSDVVEERKAVVEAVATWNAHHRDGAGVLVALGWEHLAPEYGLPIRLGRAVSLSRILGQDFQGGSPTPLFGEEKDKPRND